MKTECVDENWKVIITDTDGNPLSDVIVRTYKSMSTSSFEDTFYTDVNGVVIIPVELQTGFVKISKGGFNDQKLATDCDIQEKVIQYSNVGKKDAGNITVEILSIESSGSNKWIVRWDACALKDGIGQLYRLNSDLDWTVFGVDFRLYTGECLSEYFAHPITSIVDAKNPESIEITSADYEKAGSEPYAYVMEVTETKFPNKYLAFVRICAGDQKLTSPELKISSDVDEVPSALSMTVLNPKSCVDHDVQIEAKDKRTIQVDIILKNREVQSSDSEITVLKDQLAQKESQILELQKQIEQKNAILMEQLKVISNLAAMMQKTIFEPILNYFSLA
ncbi:MAG: hypothetical protein WD512_19525 [Candidatus Paceibacterota bacterium]